MEYKHHGDELVPRQQRFGQYTRSLMKGLEVPVLNQFGLRPAVVQGTDQIAPLTDQQGPRQAGSARRSDHVQLPSASAALRADDGRCDSPFMSWPGSRSTCPGRIRSPPRGTGSSTRSSGCRRTDERGGDILLADSTIFTTLFGGTESLEHFWRNMAKLR